MPWLFGYLSTLVYSWGARFLGVLGLTKLMDFFSGDDKKIPVLSFPFLIGLIILAFKIYSIVKLYKKVRGRK